MKKEKYWDNRFEKGFIYGTSASPIIKTIWKEIKNIYQKPSTLVLGGGYGRNAFYLSQKGAVVINSDISSEALAVGKSLFKNDLKFITIDSSKQIKIKKSFDILIAIYLLSLFKKNELKIFFKNAKNLLNKNGSLGISFLSKSDAECGLGKKLKNGAFLFDNDQYIKFYSKREVLSCVHSNGFSVLSISEVKEKRFIDILGKNVISKSWVVIAKK